jgi:DNA-binding SARP family transcriptional activator
VRLPSGSVIAASFVSGVLAALGAGRLRRRRGYRAQSPLSERPRAQDAPSGGVRDLLLAVRGNSHDEDEELGSASPSEELSPMTAIPDGDALVHPDVIEVGSYGDEVVRLGLCAWPGLVLSGPGAPDVLRAWVAALLARNGPYGVEILAVGPLSDRLFRGLEVPGLCPVETAEAALCRIERAMAARSKRLDEAEAADVIVHREVSPEDPLPLLFVITDLVPGSLEGRWRAMLDSATRLGLAALVLIPEHAIDEASGPHPRLAVEEDGSVRQAAPRSLADVLRGTRLFHLSAPDAVDLVAPIAAIHAEEFDDPATPGDPDDNGAEPDVHTNGAQRLATRSTGSLGWPAAGPESEPHPIRVDLFGTAHVEAWGEKIASGLRSSAYELLAWYALHPHGATAEAAIEALWPDTPPKRGRERFWNALGNLRSRLRGPNEDGVEILTKIGQLYHPDPSVLDIDLWRFESALDQAAQADTPENLIVALGRASACYGGDFYPTGDALWVEPVREDLHRRALDTQIRLAELYVEADQADAAIVALERAIELDPICEDAYRRLITLQGHLGRDDAAKRTWVLLQGRLAELDLEPEATTSALVREVLGGRPAWAGRPPHLG